MIKKNSPLFSMFQIAMGILLVYGLVWIFNMASSKVAEETLPVGWQIIRPPQEVSTLVLQGNTVWVGGRDGIHLLDRQTGKQKKVPPSLSKLRYVNEILVAKNGMIWIAHNGGLTRYWAETGEVITASPNDGMLPGGIATVYQDRNQQIWVGNEEGLVRYDGEKWIRYTMKDGLGTPGVTVIYQDGKGLLWFGSSSHIHGGLSSYDGQMWHTYSIKDGLAHNAINTIVEDGKGLWVGTGFANEGGASHLSNGQWKTITKKDGLAGEKVRSILWDKEGWVLFGSEYDGLALYDGEKWLIYKKEQGLAGKEIKKMLQDQEGVYWLATENGVSRIEKIH